MTSFRIAAGSALALCAFLLAPHDASAFCVYNKIASKKVFAMQLGKLKGFSGTIKPGDKACCNYKNSDCNKGGNREKMLDMETRVEIKKGTNLGLMSVGNESTSCGVETYDAVNGSGLEAKLQAGGYWVFRDNPRFDRNSKKYGWQNPPYILESYSWDHKLLKTYNCPPQQKGKPGLMDFVG